ncbi:MAG: hypothetical protein A2589_03660 [Candidatus Vogelbacteria bacterium RIFOXYD1_FULL_46_19]|uniref:Glutamyl-tRNA amidotransferase n=1 Tax=Candidatus Vogelbacteria bacterium RIFOXYD1_FULL_46_19 TaxID=1802439 RepID=A0A1G2QJ31_9BACT|nr:MAG: hypothetical protein A2589_03660 [Candidatus Vogelbacteria bacterium RIFOXYD1_FULL_46_19]
MKTAMKNKETVRLSVMRGLSAAFTNEVVAKGRKPDERLSDEEAMAVLKRAANQRKDAAEQFKVGGRPELAASEEAELAIISEFLPAQMNPDDIRRIAEQKKTELGLTDKAKIGILIGAVMKATSGTADGGDVKKIVESLFD